MDITTQKIEEIEAEIKEVKEDLAHIKSLYEIPFDLWSTKDKKQFGTEDGQINRDYLREEKILLMNKESELRKEKILLMDEKRKEEREYSGKKESLSLEAKLQVPSTELHYDGINLLKPHIERRSLLERLCGIFTTSFVLLSSPAGSGKTSLLALFAAKMDIECIYMYCLKKTLSDMLKPHGIDLKNKTVTGDKPRVIMLDSAQKTYGEKEDWTILIKNLSHLMPQTKFIMAASHSLEGGYDTPLEFGSFPTLSRSDFLLSDEEARQLLTSNNELGLPKHFQFDSLVSLISSE
ncbi:hypothetical protein ROZALSC1DRAFT_25485, partial [Rozella allomycis CSF55]